MPINTEFPKNNCQSTVLKISGLPLNFKALYRVPAQHEVPPIFGHGIKFTTKIDKGGYYGKKEKKYTAQFKAKVAFEAAKGDRNNSDGEVLEELQVGVCILNGQDGT